MFYAQIGGGFGALVYADVSASVDSGELDVVVEIADSPSGEVYSLPFGPLSVRRQDGKHERQALRSRPHSLSVVGVSFGGIVRIAVDHVAAL
jgi:hypothetical protein